MKKIGLDTNVLARLILKDDQDQHDLVVQQMTRCLVENIQITVDVTVFIELEWVLRSQGAVSKSGIVRVFKQLIDTFDIYIQDEDTLIESLYLFENSASDFAKCLFLARYLRNGCQSMLTFDTKAQQLPHVRGI